MSFEEIVSTVVVSGVVGLFSLAAGWVVLRNLLYIAGPNEVLIFSGSGDDSAGKPRGYAILKGGRRVRIPLLESVSHMDLTNMTVDVVVHGAYSKGGIPLNVQGVANLKVAGVEPALNNALERFLERPREDIIKVAKDTLEGNLRGVLSQLTPEEVNTDKIRFAEKLLDEAEHDLTKLGLVLDTLKIQNVSDDVGYLNSIGRKTSAELLRNAKIAEAEAASQAAIQDAEAKVKARVAESQAALEIARAGTDRRVRDAQTKTVALVNKEVGTVQAAIAKARAELETQQARTEQVRRRLEADVIAPAQAEMEANQADAKGKAAQIIEQGRATANVLNEMIATWQAGGENARDIFLMQKLETMLAALASTISSAEVDRLTVLPAGSSRAGQAATLVEELKAGAGVDLPKLLSDFSKKG